MEATLKSDTLEVGNEPAGGHIVHLSELENDPLVYDENDGPERSEQASQTTSINTATTDSFGKLCIKRKAFSREAFYAQAILIYIIAIACIVNLSIGTEHSHVWVSLLSRSLGFILPTPKVRSQKKNTLVGVTHDMLVEER